MQKMTFFSSSFVNSYTFSAQPVFLTPWCTEATPGATKPTRCWTELSWLGTCSHIRTPIMGVRYGGKATSGVQGRRPGSVGVWVQHPHGGSGASPLIIEVYKTNSWTTKPDAAWYRRRNKRLWTSHKIVLILSKGSWGLHIPSALRDRPMAGFGADPGWAVIEQGGLRKILPQARSQGGGSSRGSGQNPRPWCTEVKRSTRCEMGFPGL